MKYNFDEEVQRLGTYSTQWDFVADRFGKKDVIPFTISDSDFRVAPVIESALSDWVSHGIYGYTRWNHDDFKNPIMHWYRKQFATELNKDDIVYGPTVMYMIKTILQMLGQRQIADLGVIIQNPAYDGFTKLLAGLHANMDPWDFTDADTALMELEILCAKPENNVLLFCHPHNPTGVSFQAETLTKIFAICKKHNVFIISDEIHMDYVYKPLQHVPAIKVAQELAMEDQIALITSASKTFNLAALQSAYMILPDQKLRDEYLDNLRNVDCLSSASVLGMVAMMTAYEQAGDWLAQMKFYLSETFTWIEEFIATEQLPIDFKRPDATYFAWLDVSGFGISEALLQEYLLEEGVAIMGGSYYLLSGGNYLRINIAAPRSKVKKAFYALRKVYQRLQKEPYTLKTKNIEERL